MEKNSLYIELAGNSEFYSINYDRLFVISDKIKFATRIGVMYLPFSNLKSNRDYGNIRIPFELNILWGKTSSARNFLEAGVGLTLISMTNGYGIDVNGNLGSQNYKFGKIGLLRLGFRHQKETGGFMYRAGLLLPIAQDDFSKNRVGDDLFYRIWPGFSAGYSF